MFGWLSLFDKATREDLPRIDLMAWPGRLIIQLDPLRVAALGEEDGVAEVRPTAHGPRLTVKGEGISTSEPAYLLKHGDRLEIGGRLELEFRNPYEALHPEIQ